MANRQQIFTLTNGHVHVKGIYVGLSIESAKKVLLEQGFTTVDENINCQDMTIMALESHQKLMR